MRPRPRWVFGTEASYERFGDVGNVAFACGYTIGSHGDTLCNDYGAADPSIALATGSVRELPGWLAANKQPADAGFVTRA